MCVESCRGQMSANRYAAYNAAVSTCVWSPVGDGTAVSQSLCCIQCHGKHMCVESWRGQLSANHYAAYNAAVSTCVYSITKRKNGIFTVRNCFTVWQEQCTNLKPFDGKCVDIKALCYAIDKFVQFFFGYCFFKIYYIYTFLSGSSFIFVN